MDFFYRQGTASRFRLDNGFLLGGSIFIAFLIRTSGVFLLSSLFFADFVDYRRKRVFQTGYIVPYLSFFILWGISLLFLSEGQSSHLSFFQDINRLTIWGNIQHYFDVGRTFFSDLLQTPWLYPILIFFVLVGGGHRYKQDIHLLGYLLLTLGLYIIWPSQQGIRFLLPILPLFVYFSFHGIKYFFEKMERKFAFSRVLYTILLLLFVYPSLYSATLSFRNLSRPFISPEVSQGPYDVESSEMFSHLMQNTPENSTVIFFKPRVMRLLTGRSAFIATECSSLPKGDYLVINRIGGSGEQVSSKQLKSCVVALDEVFINKNFIVYQILR